MSDTLRAAIVVVAGYLLGALPFSVWIARARGVDVRRVGSGNPGATNVLRAAGRGPGLLALACDVGKGVVAVLLARLLGPSPAWWGWAALAAVCGHVFSVFLRFRGGKGVATAAGALGAVSPLALGAAMVVFVAAVGLRATCRSARCSPRWRFRSRCGGSLPPSSTATRARRSWSARA